MSHNNQLDLDLLKFNEAGLLPAIVQDATTRQVLMMAWVNRESLQRTLESGKTWFWSRSRQELWHKGATSSNTQKVKKIFYDCDGDTLLMEVEPAGPACHTGEMSCFFRRLGVRRLTMSKKALIVVDVQNDFCPNGTLAVPNGDQVIGPINKLVDEYANNDDLVVYTKDFHPSDHSSFKINHPDGIWPPHCVQETPGVEFHPDLTVAGKTFFKAFLTEKDSYSGFGGHIEPQADAQSLENYLKEQGVEEVTVVGLALDYCVKSTAIDAHNLGLKSTVILEGTRAVNVNPDDGDKAVEEMKSLGIAIQ